LTPGSLIAFALALTVAAGMPGPSVGALVARVLARGFRDVFPFLAAMWIGEALWMTMAVTGMAAVTTKFGALFATFKLLGVVWLLILAWRMWKDAGVAGGDFVPDRQPASQTFLSGLAITLGNPKIALFYLALLPSIVNLKRITFASWAELTLVMLAVLAGVDLSWSALAARSRRLLINRRARLLTNRAGATVMAGAAIAIAVH